MSKRMKIWLAVGGFLAVLGALMLVWGLDNVDWDFGRLNGVKYQTVTYNINEEFENIAFKTDTADIVFAPAGDNVCKVVCCEAENAAHSVLIRDGTLSVNAEPHRKWYEMLINFGTPRITVYLPESEYAALNIEGSTGDIEIPAEFKFGSVDIKASTGDVECRASAAESVKIKLSTGDIVVENMLVGELELAVSTGKVQVENVTCGGDVTVRVSTGDAKLTDVKCGSLISTGNTGRISLDNVVAEQRFSIERSTGDVRFEGCDAAEIFVNTDTGAVEGRLLSDKVFIVESDTGRIDVPKSIRGGRCEITTDTGNIKIRVD